LAAALRAHLTGQLISRHSFLYEMERSQQGHGVALSPFNRLIPEHQDGSGEGKLNLKYRGLLPLVESVRLLALRAGISETATLERIAGLYDSDALNVNERDYLVAAFHNLTSLLLRQQLRDYRSGNVVGPHVPLQGLSDRERDTLIDSFKAISALGARVRSEFTGAVF
jgi:CBS domain-containing protein